MACAILNNMDLKVIKICLILCFLYICTGSATGQTLSKVFGDWSVYTKLEDGSLICYTVSAPEKSSGNFNYRGQPYLMVSIINKGIEISSSSGYFYKVKSKPLLTFDNKKEYELFSKGKSSWVTKEETDEVINNLKSRNFAVIEGISTKDTSSTDQYSLKGFSAAFKQIQNACNR